MDELLSRFPDIAEDIFESLDDESLVRCKESGRSISSFMEENTKYWKRIITKYLLNVHSNPRFDKSWESLMDTKQTRPEMIKELARAVQHYLNRRRHGRNESMGQISNLIQLRFYDIKSVFWSSGTFFFS